MTPRTAARMSDANDPVALRERGLKARREGEPGEAERCFREAFEGGDPVAAHELGTLILDQGDKAGSEEWYRRAAELGVPESAFEVGYVEAERGNLEEAERWYRRAGEGGNDGGYLNLGALLRRKGAMDEAKQCFQRAWELGAGDMAAFNLGLVFDDDGKGDLIAAAEWYGRAADLGNAPAAYNLGFVWQDRGEPAKRMEAWERAAELRHHEAAVAIAEVYLSQGDVNEGVVWLRRAALEVGHKNAPHKLADIYRRSDHPRHARFWSEFPDGPTFYSPEFQEFAGEVAAASIHQQDVFNAACECDYLEWNLDEATVTMDGRIFQGLTVLGSFSNLSHTWLWTWDNPGYEQDSPALAKLHTIRAFGERSQIPELRKGQLDFSRFNFPKEGAITMAIAAAGLISAKGVTSVPINGGKGHIVLAIDDPRIPTAEFDFVGAGGLIMRAAEVWPHEQRRVVLGFLKHHGLEIDEAPAVIEVESAGGHTITVRCPLENAKQHPEVSALLDRENAKVTVKTPGRIRGRRSDGGESPSVVVQFDLDDRITAITSGGT